MPLLEFIETSYFTKRIKVLLSDDDYLKFQAALMNDPESGDIISGGGGLRKIRYAIDNNKGKSSGIRVIYYYIKDAKIYLLTVYPKSEKDNLTRQELNILRQLVKEAFNNG